MNFQAQCKCGARSYIVADRKAAEVLADVHETTARVAYRHDGRSGGQVMQNARDSKPGVGAKNVGDWAKWECSEHGFYGCCCPPAGSAVLGRPVVRINPNLQER